MHAGTRDACETRTAIGMLRCKLAVVVRVAQAFWARVIEWVPLWLAPNAITLIGIIVNVITSGLLLWYCPSAKEEVRISSRNEGEPERRTNDLFCLAQAPAWVYALCGIGLFLYQTLDAIDGKQARRTQSASPLGEMFDHGAPAQSMPLVSHALTDARPTGCDALSAVFLLLSATATLQIGGTGADLFITTIFSFVFFCVHWEAFVTGVVKFGRSVASSLVSYAARVSHCSAFFVQT